MYQTMITLNIVRSDDISSQNTKLDRLGSKDSHALLVKESAVLSAPTHDPDIEEIRMDQVPSQERWTFTPLYKISADGGMLFWQIGFDGIDHLEIKHGYSDDAIKMKYTEKLTGKDEALSQARKRYKVKYREGYQPGGADVPLMGKGMKGYEYKQNSVKLWPVYTQPKLNGIRMLCHDVCAGNVRMRSWLNNPYTHLTHIENELREFFEYLPRYATLDGELYSHNMDFSTLTSAVKTTKHVHPQLDKVQYWIFDVDYEDSINSSPFEKRYELLVNSYRRYIQDRSESSDENDITALPRTFFIVPCQLARNHQEVIQQHAEHVSNGYEGIMIKKISTGIRDTHPSGVMSKHYRETLYKRGRCNHILKYKQFIDEEGIIAAVSWDSDSESPVTHSHSGHQQTPVLHVRDRRGNIFPIKMRGCPPWHFNPQLVIGKEVTYRYQELLSCGTPLLPVGLSIRDYE